MRTFHTVTELAACKGEVLGTSDWVTITQDAINSFADASGDHQWIHVDSEKSAAGPFGATIAHGLMTLALLPELMKQIYIVTGSKMTLNYGFNRVRFPAPVPVGSRVRAQSTLVDVESVGDGDSQVKLSVILELEGSAKPAAVAEVIVRYIN